MTAKEKAKELMVRFRNADYQDMNNYGIRECALICVDEITRTMRIMDVNDDRWIYWQEVKQEIEKL
jgi:hypothetical protein